MDNDKRNVSRVESSVTADAVRSVVTDVGIAGSAPVNNVSHWESRPSGTDSGMRSIPGDLGHLYADTPSATVFVGKKQWLNEEWTYAVDEKSAEKQGKTFEILKRDVYERVITRKLQWLSDHEAFSKLRNRINVAAQFGRISEELKNEFLQKISKKDPNGLAAADLDLLKDLNSIPTGLGNSNTTRYYTTPPASNNPNSAIGKYKEKLEKLRTVQQFAGPDSLVELGTSAAKQRSYIEILKSNIASYDKTIKAMEKMLNVLGDKIKTGQVIAENPNVKAPTSSDVVLGEEYVLIQEQYDKLIAERANQQAALVEAEKVSAEYEVKLYEYSGVFNPETPTLEALQSQVEKLKTDAQKELQDAGRLVSLNAFNGIIEFNNITNISTSISLEGTGSASLTLENPNNILRISRDDLLLALTDDPYLAKRLGIQEKNAPETTQVGKVLPGLSGGRLKYYKGRYYDQTGLDIALENGGGVLDATSGFSTSDESNTLIQYRRQQQFIFQDLKSKMLASAGFPLTLPDTASGITVSYFKENQISLTGLYDNVSSAPGIGKEVYDSHFKILNKYTKKLGDALSFEDEDSSGTNNPNNPNVPNEQTVSKTKDQFSVLQAMRKIPGFEHARPTLVNDFFKSIQQHFVGKYILEVSDRVWIWLSSPSRTVQIDSEGSGLVESAVGRVAAEIQSKEMVKRLKEQLAQAEREQARLEAIQEPIATELGEREGSTESLEFPETEDQNTIIRTNALKEEFNKLEDMINLLKKQQIAYADEIEKIENERDAGSDSSKAPDYSNKVAGSAAGVLPPSVVAQSTYGGFEENQFQVFEGVITEVTGTFDGIGFTLSVRAQDLTYYLEISRVIEKPSLSSSDTFAVLNDPIYRARTGVDADISCAARFSADPTQNAEMTDVNRHPLAGRWKTGQFVTTSFVYLNSDSDRQLDSARQLGQTSAEAGISPEDLICAHGLSVMTKLYGQLDSANIISILVTGIPYNFSTYAFNTLQPSSQNTVESLTGTVEADPTNPNEILRKMVGVQNRFLGNFQPFLEFTSTFDDKEIPRLEKDLNTKISALEMLFGDRMSRSAGKALSAPKFTQEILRLAKMTDGAKRMRNRIASQGYGQAQGQRLRFFTEDEARKWKEFFEEKGGIATSSPRAVQLTNDKLDIGFKIDTLNQDIVRLERDRKVVAERMQTDPSLGIQEDQLRRAVAKAKEDLINQKLLLEKKNAELAALPKSIPGNSPDVIACITLDQQEVNAYLEIATLSTRIADLKIIKDQLYNSTQASYGLEPGAGDKPDAISLSLRKKYNQSAIQSTKRKIIEKKKVNFLLVSDQYTSNLNIRSYLQDVSDANCTELFTTQFASALSICKEVSSLVDFEFYCDENGHLRFKPPTYNRLLKAHFSLDSLDPGVRLSLKNAYPKLEILSSVSTLRLFAKIINEAIDESSLIYQQAVSAYETASRRNPDSIVTNALNYGIPQATSPDAVTISNAEETKANLLAQVEGKKQEDLATRKDLTQKVEALTTSSSNDSYEEALLALNKYLDIFNEELLVVNAQIEAVAGSLAPFVKSGTSPSRNALRTEMLQNNATYVSLASQRVEMIKSHNIYLGEITKKIGAAKFDPASLGINATDPKLSLQQKEIIANASGGNLSLLQALALEALSKVGEDPYFIDEMYIHTIGPQIILNETVTEKKPDYVRLDVVGGQNYIPGFNNQAPQILWGGGVDYDLWRTYGYSQQNIERAFLQHRDVARDYCGALLARQKSRVLSCSIGVRGDAKYRVGDCAFVEDQFMYYYITSVNHAFSYGEYTTTLTLEYSRRPGEFLAHPFDVVGRYLRNEHSEAIRTSMVSNLIGNSEGNSDYPSKEERQYAQDLENIREEARINATGSDRFSQSQTNAAIRF
jgi:hypothetical protein